MSDQHELLRSIADGDQQAFHKFYELFEEQVFGIALNYTQNVQDAEEITQDVFVKIYQNAAKFQGKSAVRTWIYRITVNSSLNLLKKKKSLNPLLPKKQIDFEHPGILLEKKEDAKLLFKAIESLSDRAKTAFILSFIEGLPRQEVADIMEISLKATESLLQRAKKKLRVKLEKMYPHRRKNEK